MTDEPLRQIRVLHVVSSHGVAVGMQSALFMPLLTRLPKQRVKARVVTLAADAVPGAVLRQNGVPVHDVALSRRRFSLQGFRELLNIVRQFRPDVIHAWGHTAQLAALAARARSDEKPQVLWSPVHTAPLPSKAGMIDRQKLKWAAKFSSKADRIVYTSEASASLHGRVGYPEEGYAVVPPGVDATRYKGDAITRAKVRERLELPNEAYVIGMLAPFQPEYDHATLIKAVAELVKSNPNIYLVLAGHGVQQGNAPLMALLGGGTLATRVRLLGEWSDVASLLNACDLFCSSALTDVSRMTLVMAMLCDVPCVATGMGAQGEVIGQFGVAVEPGSPTAFVRGITRVMELTEDRRLFMTNGARKHALKKFIQVSSLQKYLQLYQELIGRQTLAAPTAAEPAHEDAAAAAPVAAAQVRKRRPTPPPPPPRPAVNPSGRLAVNAAPKSNAVGIAELADPDSLEATGTMEPLSPKGKPDQDGDVLVSFESDIASGRYTTASKTSDRARGVADEMDDLLSPELLHGPTPAAAPVIASEQLVSSATSAKAEPAPSPPSEPIQLQLVPDEPAEPKQAAG